MTSSRAPSAEVLVLGAGLQGSCIALALASQGHRVTVLDRADEPMAGASRNSEAKIHLGYVYALDTTGVTQRRMLAGALAFAPLLDRWLGPQAWDELRTPPFRYLTMPDTLLDADALEADYARTDDVGAEVGAMVADRIGAGASYLGEPLVDRARRDPPDALAGLVSTPLRASFSTPEAAVDPGRLADTVCRVLHEHPTIRVVSGTDVRGATRDGTGFTVDVVTHGEPTVWRAPTVVNCLWEGRLGVDATVGIASPIADWTYRVKHIVVVEPHQALPLPSVTMTQGPYGDVISWRADRVALCWYPVGRTELHRISAASPNGRRMRTAPTPGDVAERTVGIMGEMFPALTGVRVVDVHGGVIVAPGTSDIDDPASRLHLRANPGVHEHDGWWTVDTGKLTLAPLLAHDASTRIDATLRGA